MVFWRESEAEEGRYHILSFRDLENDVAFEAFVQSIAGEWGFTVWQLDPDIGSICIGGERSGGWSEEVALGRAKAFDPFK